MPLETLIVILKVVKQQICLLTFKKNYYTRKYNQEEFFKFINESEENEDLIYNTKFKENLMRMQFTNQEEKDNYKKEFTLKLLDDVKTKYEIIKSLAENFNADTILKIEMAVINSYNYYQIEYVKAIEKYYSNE